MPNNSDFSVIIIRDDGPVELPEGSMTSMSDADPNISVAYISGQCDQCERVHIMEGDFEHVSTDYRAMGRERIHVSRHWAECSCGADLALEVNYTEYPRGTLQPYEIGPLQNVSYVPVQGLMYPVNSAVTQVEANSESMQASVDELREMASADVVHIDDTAALDSVFNQILESVHRNVLVLGSYQGANEAELITLKDEIEAYGYSAFLVNELPDIPSNDLEQKVATAMRMVGFCIMVDREASGHIDEYEIAKKQRALTARLTPEDGGSTRMIGSSEIVDINHIRAFEFEMRPEEVLHEAIEWSEEMLEERQRAYNEHYEWRD